MLNIIGYGQLTPFRIRIAYNSRDKVIDWTTLYSSISSNNFYLSKSKFSNYNKPIIFVIVVRKSWPTGHL